ncbi:MotA/TolQ/ExbB proton channel family protein [Parasphingorhabdus cellanae]|uniref:MotA/TolQ/ExbB proton channel family protein n=1 Tax=Parasphingorhabdus cellanae TaxID=2806553 RepID=A0ABX7T4G9_9SPHN|nr:MotA/TolQ/ExbB proton channel family protein [Parasphingorhabdus cellanae]QTD55442.1 MotA/TolQ/ExbB proton channel family protein [Parasphingorhabdus cellanae]
MSDIISANIGKFFDPLTLAMVLSSVLVMAWIQNGRTSLWVSFAALLNCGRDPFAESGENATFMCRRIDFALRENGLVGLERVTSEDPFVRRLIAQLLNGKDAKTFEEWAHLEAYIVQKKQTMAATYWSSVSDIAPAIGLMGTVIGLIQLFATGIDPLKMGPAMSFTLLTSLYGLFIANIVAYPIYVRLQARAEILNAYRAAVVQHTVAIAKRELLTIGPVHFSPAQPLRATG